MPPTLVIIGGCNGAGKSTLSRELLPRLGIGRFMNADNIARGLSPLHPAQAAFRAGRILLQEVRTLLSAGESFALESTLSGKTWLATIREAKAKSYRIILHYILVDSATRAVNRVATRVKLGGHHVPEDDIRRRFERSRQHFLEDYLPLADDWGLWDNNQPPPHLVASSARHSAEEIPAMINSTQLQESPAWEITDTSKIVLEAGRVATEKMLEFYRRMGVRVNPDMTLADDQPELDTPGGDGRYFGLF